MSKEIQINRFYNNFIKRTVDFTLALILFILLIPVIGVIAAIIKFDSKGPVFYKGLRSGYHNKSFKMYKFRSMFVNADNIGGDTTALDDKRITCVGKLLRNTKLDEIPQLINIIKGEMSFIGPRPEVLKYTNNFKGDEKYILEVRPGISDISSLTFISQDELVGKENVDKYFEKYILCKKNDLRVDYIRKQSYYIDCKLFLLTIISVLKKIIILIWRKNNVKNSA